MLELIILSDLMLGPAHGYEIKKLLSGMKVNNNTLYPLLNKLQSLGYVTVELMIQDNKPAKKVYTITDAGKDHLFELIEDFDIISASNDDAFYIRVAFFQFLPKESINRILSAREQYLADYENQAKLMHILAKFPDNSYDLLYLKNYINSRLFAERQMVNSIRQKYGITK